MDTFYILCVCIVVSFANLLLQTESASVGHTDFTGIRSKQVKVFSTNPSYVAYFSGSHKTKHIRIRLEVETHGYIGFAFSPRGTMDGSELIIGGIRPKDDFDIGNTEHYFGAYHAIGHIPRALDMSVTGWKVLHMGENETHTSMEVTRMISSVVGRGVGTGEINVIWSIGEDDDPTKQHIHRGSDKITLLTGPHDHDDDLMEDPDEDKDENVLDIQGRDAETEKAEVEQRNKARQHEEERRKRLNKTVVSCLDCPPCTEEDLAKSPFWPYASSSSYYTSELNLLALICISFLLAIVKL